MQKAGFLITRLISKTVAYVDAHAILCLTRLETQKKDVRLKEINIRGVIKDTDINAVRLTLIILFYKSALVKCWLINSFFTNLSRITGELLNVVRI